VGQAGGIRLGAGHAGLIALVLFLALLPRLVPLVVVVQATDVLIFVLFSLSLNVLVGYAGMLSLGHAAFFAVGGYGTGLVVKYLGLAMPLALMAGPLAAALAALVIGFFCVRLSHAYFIMLTLAFSQLIYTVIWKWRELTGGDDGLIGIMPAPVLVSSSAYYNFVLGVVLAAIVVLHRVGQSPFGRALRAIKDHPRRAEFIGIPVRRYQLGAFVLAGGFAGIAGSLQVFFHRGMFPNAAHWLTSSDAFTAVVLGGASYFAGPIVGASLFKGLAIAVPRVTEYWFFFLGIAILLVALGRPQGLMSLLSRSGGPKA
jgi:branched-chain amino acid transport system permease protein